MEIVHELRSTPHIPHPERLFWITSGWPTNREWSISPRRSFDPEELKLLPGQKPGPEGVKPILQGLIDAFPDLVVTLEEVIGAEHRAATRVSLSGTHLGPLLGLPASDKYVTLSLLEFHTLREGRISVTRHMEDWMGLFRQIGALPSAL